MMAVRKPGQYLPLSRPGSSGIIEMTRRSKRKGFTLIELVVVLSIMVILATLGIVGYQSSFPPGVISAGAK